MKEFLEVTCPCRREPWELSQAEILSAIRAGTLFDLVECDIHVPSGLRDYFAEMQPAFKNIDITREDIGPFMQRYAEEHDIMKRPQLTLVGSYRGDNILLATPLLKRYMQHGLAVTRVYQVIEYEPKPCFRAFGDSVSAARRAGDADPDRAILADTMKRLGNSGYGKTVTNLGRHRDVKYCTKRGAAILINNRRFRQLNVVDEDVYEIAMNKRSVSYSLPLHIGFLVYRYAKLRMLQFYYDFIDTYIERPRFQYCEMDTDSAYIALAGESVDDLVSSFMREHFFRQRAEWLPSECCGEHEDAYVECRLAGRVWETTNNCCKARKAYDKRTPGLFKIEFEGDGFIGLCSKTYYCIGSADKYSTKGLNKRQNKLNKDTFLVVLKQKRSSRGWNRGFRVKDSSVYIYMQERAALTLDD